MRQLRLHALCAALLLFVLQTSALAQSWRHAGTKRDIDEEAESHSAFWQQALATSEYEYTAAVAEAERLLNAGGTLLHQEALGLLRKTVSSKPDLPLGHYALGLALFWDQKWEPCADSLSQVYKQAPTFQRKNTNKSLDFLLGTCLLYSGKYEGAILHFKRVVTLEKATNMMRLRLGESYMALGRLDEAIDFLRQAAYPGGKLTALFALAVALDRAERLAESRKELTAALTRDRQVSTLKYKNKAYAPASERDYYLGLAYAQQAEQEGAKKSLAIYHFRHYLEAATPLWKKRAEHHLKALGRVGIARDLTVVGSASWDRSALQAAIAKQERALRGCVADAPLLLVQIDLSAVAGPGRRPLHVRAIPVTAGKLKKETLRKVLECLESSAQAVEAPRFKAARGLHTSAQFTLLGGS